MMIIYRGPSPNPQAPAPFLAAAWVDAYLDAASRVSYAKPDAQTMVIQYEGLRLIWDPTGSLDCQVTLSADGSMRIDYRSDPADFLVGIQGKDGLANMADVSSLGAQSTVLFTPIQTFLHLSPDSGQLSPTESTELTVHIDASLVPVGTHQASLVLTDGTYSNIVPLSITVSGHRSVVFDLSGEGYPLLMPGALEGSEPGDGSFRFDNLTRDQDSIFEFNPAAPQAIN